MEESNKLLHKTSAATNRNYKDINVELDKYERAFDVLDLVLSSVQTGFGVYKTCDVVKDKLGKYEKLIKEYKDKVLLRGKIESADTLLLTVNARAIKNIQTEVKNIWQDFVIIGGYASELHDCYIDIHCRVYCKLSAKNPRYSKQCLLSYMAVHSSENLLLEISSIPFKNHKTDSYRCY